MVSVLEAVGGVKGKELTQGRQPVGEANSMQPNNGIAFTLILSPCLVPLALFNTIAAACFCSPCIMFAFMQHCNV